MAAVRSCHWLGAAGLCQRVRRPEGVPWAPDSHFSRAVWAWRASSSPTPTSPNPTGTRATITPLTRPGRPARAAENRSLPGSLPAAVVKPTGCTTFAQERLAMACRRRALENRRENWRRRMCPLLCPLLRIRGPRQRLGFRRRHAGGNGGVLPRTRRRSIHASLNLFALLRAVLTYLRTDGQGEGRTADLPLTRNWVLCGRASAAGTRLTPKPGLPRTA